MFILLFLKNLNLTCIYFSAYILFVSSFKRDKPKSSGCVKVNWDGTRVWKVFINDLDP